MIILTLALLIPAAYYTGRYVQWTTDAKRVMGPWSRKKQDRWP
jgi:hypothetical protein